MSVRKPHKLPDFRAARERLLVSYRRWSRPDPGLDDRVAWYERAILLRKLYNMALSPAPTGSAEGTGLREEEIVRLLGPGVR